MTKVLLITGASSGIGAATARAAIARGWTVGLVARSADRLDALAGELGPDRAMKLVCDVSDAAALAAAVASIVTRFGRLDAVFANAGLGSTAAGVETGDLENWRAMLETNIWGLIATAKVTLPELRKTKGRMLLTGSQAGRMTIKGSIYGASKHFVHAFAANLMEEMREWGGSCTIIAPGLTDTPFFESRKPEGLKPEDVADAVIYAIEQPPRVSIGEVYLVPQKNA